MRSVSIRDLQSQGYAVVTSVARGEHIVITRDGIPVAELRPIRGAPLSTSELIRRRSHLPHVDLMALRADIDSVADPSPQPRRSSPNDFEHHASTRSL